MTGFRIICKNNKGESALNKAIDEEKSVSIIKKVVTAKIIRKIVVKEKPLTVDFNITSKKLSQVYSMSPESYKLMIFQKYADDVMIPNGATKQDYEVELI